MPMNVTLPLWWILGLLVAGIAGSYVYTWLAFNLGRKSNAKLWDAITDLKTNEIKHLEERLTKIETRF